MAKAKPTYECKKVILEEIEILKKCEDQQLQANAKLKVKPGAPLIAIRSTNQYKPMRRIDGHNDKDQ